MAARGLAADTRNRLFHRHSGYIRELHGGIPMGCFLLITRRDLRQLRDRLRKPGAPMRPARQQPSKIASKEERVRRTLIGLAKADPSLMVPLLPYYTKLVGIRYASEVGKAGEQVAETVLEKSQQVKVVERTTGKGVDLKARGPGGKVIVAEVKTSTLEDKPFDQLLEDGYGHKQCSDGWLKAVGVDPSKARVLGVRINPERETVSLYRRRDRGANQWRCIMRDAPLSEFGKT